MIAYILIGFLWICVMLLYCEMIRLKLFATETIENLRTLNQLVLKQIDQMNKETKLTDE